MTSRRRPRPAGLGLAILVMAILGIGLAVGLFVDNRFATRPVGTLVSALVAAHVAFAIVYRVFGAGLRRATEETRELKEE